MKKSLLGLLVAAGVALTSFWVVAAENVSTETKITEKITAAIPQLPISQVSKSDIAGFYEVELANGERIFTNAEADYFIAGDLFQVGDNQIINLSELKRDGKRAEQIAALEPNSKITFTPENKKASVTVFTDIDCGYCRMLHQQMAGYMERGIEIQYLAFPRAGIGSNSYNKIVSAWCADDKQDAMTKLKSGESIADATCENPVADHYRLGMEIGVTGTPALVLESGKLVPGFIEPERLARLLEI